MISPRPWEVMKCSQHEMVFSRIGLKLAVDFMLKFTLQCLSFFLHQHSNMVTFAVGLSGGSKNCENLQDYVTTIVANESSM